MKRRHFIRNAATAGVAAGLVPPAALPEPATSQVYGARVPSPRGRGATIIHAIDTHAAGMHARVIMGGVGALNPPGATMREKRDYFMAHDDWFRRFMLREPRGFPTAMINLVVPPTQPGAHAGYLTFNPAAMDPTAPKKETPEPPSQFRVVSGTNTMATAAVLLETGVVPMREPTTEFVLESPVGLIPITARCASGRVLEVAVEMAPPYPTLLAAPLDVPGLGKIRVDVVTGYVMTEAAALGLVIDAAHGAELVRLGNEIKAAARKQLKLPIGATMFFGPAKDPRNHGRQVGAFPHGVFDPDRRASWGSFLDRSPTGSATACRLALMHAKGQLKVGDEFRVEGVLDTVFVGRILRETTVDGRRTIRCTVAGRVWITGYCDYVVEPDDPFPTGFTVGDLWPS